jgi:hypothetical protein
VEEALREIRGGHDGLAETDLDIVASVGSFGLDTQFVASRKDQEASLRARVLQGHYHEPVDQFLEDDLAGHRLEQFDDCREVQVLDRRPQMRSRSMSIFTLMVVFSVDIWIVRRCPDASKCGWTASY